MVPANPLGLGTFSLRDRVTGTAAVYLFFDNFAAALDAALAQGGTYDAGTNAIAVGVVGVVLD